MRLSIIIVSYNVQAALQRCLASLRDTAAAGLEGIEIIVVDNASTDASVALVQDLQRRAAPPALHLLALPVNCGFSRAVNLGVARSQGAALLLLNPDTELPADALPHMLQLLQQDAAVWAAGFRQVDASNFWQLAMGWQPNWTNEWLRRSLQRRLHKRQAWVAWGCERYWRRPQPVAWVAGSALLVRRRAFKRVGGFDERFFLYFEDIDFCLRLQQAGGRVLYDPRVTLLHHGGLSARQAPRLARQAYRASQLYFWDKHRPRSRLMQAYVYARQLTNRHLGA